MAGIGIDLHRVFKKQTIVSALIGVGYSTIATIAPMLVIMVSLLLMYFFLGYDSVLYYDRELFACSLLYIFIFSLLTSSPLNSVISKYVTDKIFDEEIQDVLPCYYVGLLLNLVLSCALGIPFYLYEIIVGGVLIYYVFTSFCCYVALCITFYSMLYLSVTKDYKAISLFYTLGALTAFLSALILVKVFGVVVTYAMLVGLSIGFTLIAALQFSLIKHYFHEDSKNYAGVFEYFKGYWKLIFANLLYVLGLFIHNFVFWCAPTHLVVANTYVCNQSYDMASCIAMFTNISASVLFITQVEMHFSRRYKYYSEMIIGGRMKDIKQAKSRMFTLLAKQLATLVQAQFSISAILFLLCMVILPKFGFSGLTMDIYPSLAAGYFVLFLMYSAIIFLYYFEDLDGALWTSSIFALVTFVVSLLAMLYAPARWYGIGVFAGAISGWTIAYFRLRYCERSIDTRVFCRGSVLKKKFEIMPGDVVYSRNQKESE